MQRAVIRATVALFLACAGGVTANASISTSTYPNLAGTTTIRAESSGYQRVIIPKGAFIDMNAAKAFDIVGGGRVLAVSLIEQTSQMRPDFLMFLREPKETGRPMWYWVTAGETKPKCSSPVPDPTGVATSCYEEPTGPGRLRRGIYNLRVITDAPVTITLHFASLAGSVSIEPATPIPARFRPLEVTSNGSAGFAAGGSADQASYERSTLTFAWGKPSGPLTSHGTCEYVGRDGLTGAGQSRWLPGCPFADQFDYRYTVQPTGLVVLFGGGFGTAVGISSLAPGKSGLLSTGAWMTGQSVTGFGGLVVWYRDDASTGRVDNWGWF